MQEKVNVYYSASNNAFYSALLKDDYDAAGTWPDDADPISDVWYQHLMSGQTDGKIISPNEYGQPVLSAQSPPAKELLVDQAESRKNQLMQKETEVIATLQDAVDFGEATEQEKALLPDWRKYRILLNRVKTSAAPDIDWPEAPGDVA